MNPFFERLCSSLRSHRSTAVAVTLLFAPVLSAQGLLRTFDGTGNNLLNPTLGAAGTALLRVAAPEYGDGISTPAGALRPSARAVSNGVCAQTGSVLNGVNVTDMLWQWGQFIDHDLDLTDSAAPAESFPVAVPMGDPFFDPFNTGTQVIGLSRSEFMPSSSPRQQRNAITSFVDGSMVYGSDDFRAGALRDFTRQGHLKTSAGNLMPFNTYGLPNAMSNSSVFFLAGDVRANEQTGLACMHTLFVREHNLLCDAINTVFPGLHPNIVYQLARALVAAEIQVITYEEFLPALLGTTLPAYAGYDPNVNPGIANEFSTAAYRVGHTLLSPTLLRLDGTMSMIPQGHLDLRDAFFNPSRITNEGGIDPVLRGLVSQRPQEIDTQIVDDVRNFLFGPPGSGGFDLASLNIQRGRDHGIANYNATRVAYGLLPKATFADVTSDATLAATLQSLYGTPNDMDLWVGGLAEDHVSGGLVGETFFTIIADQFQRVRDGDRFWYQNYLPEPFLSFVQSANLADIIRRNTGIGAEIQNDAFHLPAP